MRRIERAHRRPPTQPSVPRPRVALWLALGTWLGLLFGMLGASPARAIDVHRPEVKAFINHMAEQYQFSKHQLKKTLAAAHSEVAILDIMTRPAEKAKPWYEYRSVFLTDRRIEEGTAFWLANRAALDQAALRTGVAPEYLAAVLGVETYYGRLTGTYRVIDALSTLAFDYPPRAPFFRSELEQYLLLAREMRFDPLVVKGSYAGAMGAPQFMPSNYRKFAVDANEDGHIDLWSSWPDVCTSVGNYLKEHGWNPGEPVLVDAEVDPEQASTLDGRSLELNETVASLKAKGVRFESPLPDDAPAVLIAADEPDGVHWRVGFNNFYVITRYNHSALYAMAVDELATLLKQRVLAHDVPRPGDPPLESSADASHSP